MMTSSWHQQNILMHSHSWSFVVTRGHSWSLVVTRGLLVVTRGHSWSTCGHSWSFVVTCGHSCVLLGTICFVLDLYQSYPQIFQATQMISFFVLSHTGTYGKKICVKNDPCHLSVFNFHKQVCATGSTNG